MLDYKPYSGYIGYNLLVIYKHIVYRIRDTGTRYIYRNRIKGLDTAGS